jgi:hypothetical protein
VGRLCNNSIEEGYDAVEFRFRWLLFKYAVRFPEHTVRVTH